MTEYPQHSPTCRYTTPLGCTPIVSASSLALPGQLFSLDGISGQLWRLYQSGCHHNGVYCYYNQNRYKVTFLGLVPSMAQQLLAHPMIDQVDFSSVLTFVCVGAYLPRDFALKLASLPQKAARFNEGISSIISYLSSVVQHYFL